MQLYINESNQKSNKTEYKHIGNKMSKHKKYMDSCLQFQRHYGVINVPQKTYLLQPLMVTGNRLFAKGPK